MYITNNAFFNVLVTGGPCPSGGCRPYLYTVVGGYDLDTTKVIRAYNSEAEAVETADHFQNVLDRGVRS